MSPYLFIAAGIVLLAIYFFTKKSPSPPPSLNKNSSINKTQTSTTIKSRMVEQKNYGQLCIFFGSQTGTAAKLSEQLAEQATEQGFQPEVVDLKNAAITHFQGVNRLSIFLLANTGQGDPPDNTVHFLNVLKDKESLDQVNEIQWKKMNYTIFGLGNTQYEHYNEMARVFDALLKKKKANKVYETGEGDDNCSLEDDFTEWKKNLWAPLKSFREKYPLNTSEQRSEIRKNSQVMADAKPISNSDPILASYRIFLSEFQQNDPIAVQSFDFKTKASLNAEKAEILGVKQIRQNEKDGSTLEIEIKMKDQPEYQTAGNIALYSKNDPKIVKEIADYFKLTQQDLSLKVNITQVNKSKKLKLNFVPSTLRELLEESIDIQGRITKSILKKLAKFQSKNQQYFTENSSPKTTEEYKRITEKAQQGNWYNLIRIVKEYQVKLNFEDFVQLSDSMAPRLFTIASHAKTQKNVIVAASLVPNGLISKFFQSKPQEVKAELRKSTFTDAMKWKRVIFVAAGTGLAPFRAFIQEKIYNLQQNMNAPEITLYFGCKHENGDFIYKEEIMSWKEKGILNKVHFAFSRDSEKKVYVQNLLSEQQADLKDLSNNKQSAIYMCGSLPMGNSIMEVLSNALGGVRVKEMEQQGRIVKQLW